MPRLAKGLLIALLAAPVAFGEIAETRATLRQHALELINRDRALYSLPPVKLDPHASAIGDDYCREQIRTRSTGHYSTSGLAPYMRYSFAGGNDGVSENAAAWSAGYVFNERALYEMIGRTQDAMMAEMPPRDGHKKTILDPHATHVGIGLAWDKGEFRLVQLFVRRYLEWTRPLPRQATPGQEIIAAGRLPPGSRLELVSVHHEPLPRPMAAQVASAFETYSLPDARREYRSRPKSRAPGDDRSFHAALRYSDDAGISVTDDGQFRFRVPLSDGPGIYTVVVWLTRDAASPVAASNVSIRVESALQGPVPGAFGR